MAIAPIAAAKTVYETRAPDEPDPDPAEPDEHMPPLYRFLALPVVQFAPADADIVPIPHSM